MKYRKKPVVIEAVQWTGANYNEIRMFTRETARLVFGFISGRDTSILIIPTLEGDMQASVGDYIIKGVDSEFYPCKPEIFEKTYEEVAE